MKIEGVTRNVISMCKLNVNIIVIINSEQVTAFSDTNQTLEHEYFNDHDIIFTNIDLNETERGMGNDGKCY